MKKCGFLVVTVLALSLMFATVVSASNVDGRITARVNLLDTVDDPADNRTALMASITEALDLLATTVPAESGASVPTTQYWVPTGIYNTLQATLEAARIVASSSDVARGETFAITIGIADNKGFAGMVFRVGFPTQLEVTSFADHGNLFDAGTDDNPIHTMDFYEGFEAPINTDGSIAVIPGTGGYNHVHAGWAKGRPEHNFEGSNDLFTFTVRVPANATVAQLPAITLELANAIEGFEKPTNTVPEELNILLPCGKTADTGVTSQIGHIRVVE